LRYLVLCLQLKNHRVIDKYVGKVITYDAAMKCHFDRELLPGTDVGFFKRHHECILINFFEETVPKFSVNPHRCSDDLVGQFLKYRLI